MLFRSPDSPGKTITFRTTKTEAQFLRDLPIHKSQRELSVKELKQSGISEPLTDNVYFEIFVCPNEALIMEFCKYSGRLEVLSPEDVRSSVAEHIRAAAEQYGI